MHNPHLCPARLCSICGLVQSGDALDCYLPQEHTTIASNGCSVLQGLSAAGDNYIKVWLTGPSGGGPAQCTVAGGYCFTAANQLNNFATSWPSILTPGLYTLNVDVSNISGPTGMFIKAEVEGQCTKEPVKPGKGQDI